MRCVRVFHDRDVMENILARDDSRQLSIACDEEIAQARHLEEVCETRSVKNVCSQTAAERTANCAKGCCVNDDQWCGVHEGSCVYESAARSSGQLACEKHRRSVEGRRRGTSPI